MAQFDEPLDDDVREYLTESGLDYCRVVGCLKWIWLQALSGGDRTLVRDRVGALVDSELERLEISPLFHHRPRHNVLLIACALFASSTSQLARIAEAVVDSSGFRSYTASDDGSRFTCAWSGILKYAILGDLSRASEEASVVWPSYRPPEIKATTKPLTTPWLRQDWSKFRRAQQRDFDTLWTRARKYDVVRSETKRKRVVSAHSISIEQSWPWAHCAMALWAVRHGADVITDPFWFPPHSLSFIPDA